MKRYIRFYEKYFIYSKYQFTFYMKITYVSTFKVKVKKQGFIVIMNVSSSVKITTK